MMTRLDNLLIRCRKENVEVFYIDGNEARRITREAKDEDTRLCAEGERCYAGWYYWFCFPGCIPDSDYASGPFKSRTAACEDALDGIDDD